MSTQNISINPFLIKEVLKTYSDKSFMNHQKICKEYYHLYHNTAKKMKDIKKDKLRSNVKNWFFEQSLENRIKLCTVENEFICQIIYQMYYYTKTDKSIKFIPKAELTDNSEINQNNTLNNFKNFSQFDINYFFYCKPDSDFNHKYNRSMVDCYGEEENDKKYNSSIDEFINEIKFFSVHHKPDPDCFCLSPNFLLKEERFDTTFNYLGNINYFTSLIQPYYNTEKNIYSYMLPDWFANFCSFSITQYIFGFIEQAIMIKYILNNFIKKKNKNYKKNSAIFSLIDDENLNDIFNDRKMVINYININYTEKNSKKQLVNDSKIENIFTKYSNYDKFLFFKEFRKDINYKNLGSSLLVQPFYGNSNNYIFNTLYDGLYSSASNRYESLNKMKLNEIKCKINEIIDRTDNITFIDFLLFQNFKEIWDIEYFINFGLIEYFIYIFKKQNENDLLKLKEEKKPSKKRRKKKKKNNNEVENNINDKAEINNNTDRIDDYDRKSKENENNLFKIELECYKELFKEDEEKLLYVPYYLSNNLELKNLYKKKFNNKLKIIEKNNKKHDKKEIINYIRNEFLLKYIINKVVYLPPDNYVSFFGNNNKIINNNIEDKPSKISGLKLRKSTNKSNFSSEDNFGTITINLNPNRIINRNESSNNIDNDNNDDNDVNDKNSNKDKLNGENKIINKYNKIRINSREKKRMNNLINKTEEKSENINNINNTNNTNNNDYSISESSNTNNNSDSKIKNNNNNKSIHKKREKSQNIFFLFDTVKNKNKNKKKSNPKNNIKSEKSISQNIKFTKINGDLSFNENLHNSILKNEKKVNNILQLLIKYKNYCIEEIKKLIKKTYDDLIYDYSIGLYGSFITGLMIEASDIDIRIKINNCKNIDFEKYFFTLYNKLEEEKNFETITPISTASVPVIKLVINIEKFIANQKELKTEFNRFKQLARFKDYLFDKNELLQIKIDITFIINKIKNNNKNENNLEIANKTQHDKLNINSINDEENKNQNELSSVSYIKSQLEEYPEIKPILMLLKRYFNIKKMNSSFEGGLSSYNLFLLILSFAKYQNIYNSNSNEKHNLGYFLIQFLEFFGKIFDFKNYLININSPYIYLNNYDEYSRGKSLMILDPLTGFNASKSSFKIDEIQNTFLSAYNFFEKEKINYENEVDKNETNDKRNHDKNNKFEVILGLAKIHKNDYNKKNDKGNKVNSNIIDKFFCT